MMEVMIKKGFCKEVSSYVTLLQKPIVYGELAVFYIDSDSNTVSLRKHLSTLVSEGDFSDINFACPDYLFDLLREFDESALEHGFICRGLVLIWTSPSNEKLTVKVGDFINVFELFNEWEGELMSEPVCFFPSRMPEMFIGSGTCIPLLHRADSDTHVYLIGDNTVAQIESASKGFSPEQYRVDLHGTRVPKKQKSHALDFNKYKESVDAKNLSQVFTEIEKEYFDGKVLGYSQFLVLVD